MTPYGGVAKKWRRRWRKQKKNKAVDACSAVGGDGGGGDSAKKNSEAVEIEYITEKTADLDEEFRIIIEKFNFSENLKKDEAAAVKRKADIYEEQKDSGGSGRGGGVSNKKKKKKVMQIGELKLMSSRPDVVEVWDGNSSEPKLLVYLKSYRNTVPVPRHWCEKKRNFLLRGFEKKPYQLPERIRQAYVDDKEEEKEDKKKLKQKKKQQYCDRKMDIDYQVLHDAFFKYQTKPKLTCHGEVYDEGKEFEVKPRREMKPGVLSQELKKALGMPEGATCPPWLLITSKQRYGDVFGEQRPNYKEEAEDKTEKHWGELEEVEEIEDDIQTVDSLSSTPTDGIETPDVIDLRKQKQQKEAEKSLYQVLAEKEETIGTGTLFGTSHTYVFK